MQRSKDHLPILLEVVRSTLDRLRQEEELAPDDPALREIKSRILRTIARREREMDVDEKSVA